MHQPEMETISPEVLTKIAKNENQRYNRKLKKGKSSKIKAKEVDLAPKNLPSTESVKKNLEIKPLKHIQTNGKNKELNIYLIIYYFYLYLYFF